MTIRDVRQDEARGVSRDGTTIGDAANCTNEGHTSSVKLRSDRSDGGNGRNYHIRIDLEDPSCAATAKADEVLIVVLQDENTMSLKPEEDGGQLTASYAGPTLECVPQHDDRLARRL